MKLMRTVAIAAAVSMFSAASIPAAADPVPGVPGFDVTVSHDSQHSPVYIVRAPWFQSNQGTAGTNFIQCIDFRVLSRKPVSAVRFTLHFTDQFNNEHFIDVANGRPWNLERRGNFFSGQVVNANHDPSKTYLNDQNESCWVVPAAFADTGFRNITKMSIVTTQVAFTDGTVWTKGQSFDQAFLPNGNAARTPINVSQRWATASRAPIELVRSGTGYDFGGNPQQCVSFRNVSGEVATTVDFTIDYLDGSNNTVLRRDVSHVGTFTPPVLIEDKCTTVNLGNAAQIGSMRVAEVHVSHVVFNDGTQWHEGDGFTRVYGNNGDRLGSPIFVAASSTINPNDQTTQPSVLPDVQTFGPNDGNGAPLAPGQRFGAIAADRTGTFAAIATNYSTAGGAGADAIASCNTKSGGNTCEVKLSFSNEPCAAIAKRVLQGTAVGFFATGGTQRDAEANALTKAGMTDASILASGCNTP